MVVDFLYADDAKDNLLMRNSNSNIMCHSVVYPPPTDLFSSFQAVVVPKTQICFHF